MWEELNFRVERLEEENRRLARETMSSRYQTARERLVKRYRIFIILALVMIVYMSALILLNPLAVEKYKLATAIYWGVFLAAEAAIDTYLMIKVQEIDLYNSTVSEIASKAARNWRIHKIAVAIGMPLAIGACVLLALLYDADNFIIFGMIVGGVIGLAIGIFQLLKFMNYYKLLQSEN